MSQFNRTSVSTTWSVFWQLTNKQHHSLSPILTALGICSRNYTIGASLIEHNKTMWNMHTSIHNDWEWIINNCRRLSHSVYKKNNYKQLIMWNDSHASKIFILRCLQNATSLEIDIEITASTNDKYSKPPNNLFTFSKQANKLSTISTFLHKECTIRKLTSNVNKRSPKN